MWSVGLRCPEEGSCWFGTPGKGQVMVPRPQEPRVDSGLGPQRITMEAQLGQQSINWRSRQGGSQVLEPSYKCLSVPHGMVTVLRLKVLQEKKLIQTWPLLHAGDHTRPESERRNKIQRR